MNVSYNDKTDLLYICLTDKFRNVINKRIDEDVVLDIGRRGKIVGIEILNASKHVDINRILPVKYGRLVKA